MKKKKQYSLLWNTGGVSAEGAETAPIRAQGRCTFQTYRVAVLDVSCAEHMSRMDAYCYAPILSFCPSTQRWHFDDMWPLFFSCVIK